ncbi:Rho guanine nucleotide exchange factor 10 [Orchesella cincta]|uniref:Rho guanine nucleotide exchange factor 10 n=1 Tax=Orchesella cincta TaxID=48709 RepID=A0A1D2M8J8_ORCCI|nr:Rho guanine nucleotide exchange factor 10 [Orchesella cincta]
MGSQTLRTETEVIGCITLRKSASFRFFHRSISVPASSAIISDVPKAPKFRRGTQGLKDKWRESWSHSKTMSKNNLDEDNRLLRWFSLRKNSATMDPSAPPTNHRHSTLPQLTEEDLKRISFMEDEEGYWPRRTVQPPSLPPPPPDLSSDQITRRHIVAAIVHSENSYVAALQRLVNEYKKPLECSHPAMLSHSKISSIFHRVPEILQCHSLFRIALAECVRRWDAEEKIGDVFVASFSKSLVLDVYSEFINNFGTAMETAKLEARRKSAFAEFLKVKQMTAHDRLSLFGLMVKPVQRFPQFILLLQDLLKHTPRDHHDRMSLQLALTQLESLAAMLNERKRESEQYQAFKETIKSIGGGKFVLLRNVMDDPNRILLRQDVVTQLEFDSNGGTVAKSKCRKLLLLNDMLICTTLPNTSSSSLGDHNLLNRKNSSGTLGGDDSASHNGSSSGSSGKTEKCMFKWSFPVREVEVEDISISPTMSRFVQSSGGNKGNKASPEDTASIVLLEEMQSLMHDYEVLSRVLGLVQSLKSAYEGLTEATVKELMLEIQYQIQRRDEQISYFDSSCLTLLLGAGNNKEKVIFQMQSPQARNEWIEELRLAQLALDPSNSPAWDIPQESPYPLHKLPLFVRALPVCKSPHLTTVKCGCYFTHTFVSQTGRSKILDYLWVSSTDGMSSHITAFRSQQNALKEVSSFDLVEEKVNDLLFVMGHIWMGTESRKIMVYDPSDPDKGSIGHYLLSDSVIKLTLYNNSIYAGLADGNLAVFTELANPTKNLRPEVVVKLGSERITSIFGSRDSIYAACGNAVVSIDAKTHIIERNVVLTHHNGPISHMACSGVGLWIATHESGTVCLYHLESLQHLQDVSIAPSVFRTVRDSFRRQKGVYVTCLMAHKGWLWIGTNLGVVLTIPLPT